MLLLLLLLYDNNNTASHERQRHSFLGRVHGIVGGAAVGESTDLERASRMIPEAHTPFGAPSCITAACIDNDCDYCSDNRDFSIEVSHQILIKSTHYYSTKEELVNNSIRRGLLHGLLIRLTLCMDAVKGPQKGKAPIPSELLVTQCTSVRNAIYTTRQFPQKRGTTTRKHGYNECMEAILTLTLCQIIVVVCAGQNNNDDGSNNNKDSLSSREEYATVQLESIVMPKLFTSWLDVPEVCRFLPDMPVPLIAVFRNTANLFTRFGWGKRKCRPSTVALAKLANAVKEMVVAMRTELSWYDGFIFVVSGC